MARIHLFEFNDMSWYPQAFRDIQTDYLQFASSLGSGHKNLIPLFQKALRCANTLKIIDLCSGGMGPWKNLIKQLHESGLAVTVTLTDKFPNPKSLSRMTADPTSGIEYCTEPIDALNVPEYMRGMRTLFEGFHHFKPDQARAILKDAQEGGNAIGIFDAGLIPPFGILLLVLSPILTFLAYFMVTPFVKPFSFSRIFWTYFLPVVPLVTCWDGVVSLMRVYSVGELNDLVIPLRKSNYVWEIGQAGTGTPIFDFIYVVGYPVR